MAKKQKHIKKTFRLAAHELFYLLVNSPGLLPEEAKGPLWKNREEVLGFTKDQWGYIPFMGVIPWLAAMTNIIHKLNPNKEKRFRGFFCEIGAGQGVYAMLANKIFYLKSTAIEINKEFEKSNSKMAPSAVNRLYIDAFDHNYGEYDIIYSYIPWKNQELTKKFVSKLYEEMKEGSFLIPTDFPRSIVLEAGFEPLKFADFHLIIYQKITGSATSTSSGDA